MRIEKKSVWVLLDPHTGEPVQSFGDEYMCRGVAKSMLDRMVHEGRWDLREQYPVTLARVVRELEHSEFAASKAVE